MTEDGFLQMLLLKCSTSSLQWRETSSVLFLLSTEDLRGAIMWIDHSKLRLIGDFNPPQKHIYKNIEHILAILEQSSQISMHTT